MRTWDETADASIMEPRWPRECEVRSWAGGGGRHVMVYGKEGGRRGCVHHKGWMDEWCVDWVICTFPYFASFFLSSDEAKIKRNWSIMAAALAFTSIILHLCVFSQHVRDTSSFSVYQILNLILWWFQNPKIVGFFISRSHVLRQPLSSYLYENFSRLLELCCWKLSICDHFQASDKCIPWHLVSSCLFAQTALPLVWSDLSLSQGLVHHVQN